MGVRLRIKHGKGKMIYFKNIIKSLALIISSTLVFDSQIFTYNNVYVYNTSSDTPIYAAIYYKIFSANLTSNIVKIDPGDSVTIELPPYKIFKTRTIFVTKNLGDFERCISVIDAINKFFNCTAEVGTGKDTALWIVYKNGILLSGKTEHEVTLAS